MYYLLIFLLLNFFNLEAADGPIPPLTAFPKMPYSTLQPPSPPGASSAISIVPAPRAHLVGSQEPADCSVPIPPGYGSSQPVDEEKKDTEVKEDYTPEGHPVLSNSSFAKRYVKCSTLCCFVSEKWFRTAGFLAGVGTVALTALSYGLPAGELKDNIILSNLIIQIAGVALNKFAAYAHSTVHDDENQFKMFKPDPASKV